MLRNRIHIFAIFPPFVVVGAFEEEEEGTGVASDVVTVEGEDPATPGPLKMNDPGTVTIPQFRFNKTKQNTHFTNESERTLDLPRPRSRQGTVASPLLSTWWV